MLSQNLVVNQLAVLLQISFIVKQKNTFIDQLYRIWAAQSYDNLHYIYSASFLILMKTW